MDNKNLEEKTKERNGEIFKWGVFFILPSIEIIFIIAFTKIIVEEAGWKWGISFFIILLVVLFISIKNQIDKTLKIFGIE